MRKIEREIRFEEDTIDLLKADWSLLTQPSRLQKLAEIYQAELALQPIEPHQIVEPGRTAVEAGRASRTCRASSSAAWPKAARTRS